MYANQPDLAFAKQMAHSFDPRYDCLFQSADCCYVSRGIKRCFTVAQQPTTNLVARVQAELATAADTDMLFGVIPFEPTQAARFIVPKQTARWERAALHSWLGAELSSEHKGANSLLRLEYLQGKQQFIQMVEQAKNEMLGGGLEKIVLAKQVRLTFQQPIDRIKLLYNLLQQNSHGHHFSVPWGEQATLTGVSPELLLRKSAGQLTTNPLAGSLARLPSLVDDIALQRQLMASHKDRHEHQIVIDEIRQVLTPLCQSLEIPDTPSLLATSTMWHLSTQINAIPTDPALHVLATALALHPTPALCGRPTKQAFAQIRQLERTPRQAFSGLVGWCDQQGNGEWVVVIRCGLIENLQATLFAGAGIVAASDALSEWQETEAKLKTMLQALQIYPQYQQMSEHCA